MVRKHFNLDEETVRRIEEMAAARGSGKRSLGKMSEVIREIVADAYAAFKSSDDMEFIQVKKRTRVVEAHELGDGNWLVRVDGRDSIVPGHVFEKTYEVVES